MAGKTKTKAKGDDAPPSQLCDAILASNPFAANRIFDPSQLSSDVAEIHAAEFERLTKMADLVRKEGIGLGATLLGSPGVGKSHLLGRLGRWARDQGACYVYLNNIQAAPEEMGRYLLKCCVARLAEDRVERLQNTLLFRVVQTAIKNAAKEENITALSEANRQEVFQRLAKRIGGDGDVFNVILRFYESALRLQHADNEEKRNRQTAKVALAVRWLKGELLDAAAAKTIGMLVLPGCECTRLSDDKVLSVILMIARLARVGNRQFILCVDQIDTMRHDRLKALVTELHHLVDGQAGDSAGEVTNLLVVIAGVEEDLRKLYEEKVFSQASAARLSFSDAIVLNPIKRKAGAQLLASRTEQFFDRFSLPGACKPFFQNDALFPLGTEWYDQVVPEGRTRPRDVLSFGRRRWDEIQNRIRTEGPQKWFATWRNFEGKVPPIIDPPPKELQELIDQKVSLKLDEAVHARCMQRGNLPADAGNLMNLTKTLLDHCIVRRDGYTIDRIESCGLNDPINLVVYEKKDGPIRNHAQFVVTNSKTSVAARLLRLLDQPTDFRLLVTDHDREPLQLGAAGRERFEKLEKMGVDKFAYVPLKFEEYARLDAMVSVLADAQSGDVEIELPDSRPREVKEAEVIDSYHRQDLYRTHKLLQYFLTEPTNTTADKNEPPFPKNNEFREFVVHRLKLLMGANLIDVLKSYIAQEEYKGELEPSLKVATTIILKMHDDKVVSAQPWNNDFFLTLLHHE